MWSVEDSHKTATNNMSSSSNNNNNNTPPVVPPTTRPSWKNRFGGGGGSSHRRSKSNASGSEQASVASVGGVTVSTDSTPVTEHTSGGGSLAQKRKSRKSIRGKFRHLLPLSPSNKNNKVPNTTMTVLSDDQVEVQENPSSITDTSMNGHSVVVTATEESSTTRSSRNKSSAVELLKWKDAVEQQRFMGEVQRKQLLKERDGFCRRVDNYDGQVVVVDQKPTYELGNYLGGGVAGVVYEGHRLRPITEYPVRNGLYDKKPMLNLSKAQSMKHRDSSVSVSTTGAHEVAMEVAIETATSKEEVVFMMDHVDAPSRSRHAARAASELGLLDETVAIKILNPVGFRMLSPDATSRGVVIKEGQPLSDDVLEGRRPMTDQHVWWLVNPNSRNLRTLQRFSSRVLNTSSKKDRTVVDRGSPEKGLRLSLIAAYVDPKTNSLRELPLTKCIEIWGHVPFSASDAEFEQMMDAIERVNAGHGPPEAPPSIPSFQQHHSNSPPPSRVATDNSSGSNLSLEQEMKPVTLSPKRTGLFRAAEASRSTMYCAELNAYIAVPAVPPKYLRWLRQRRAATKEIRNMMLIGRHKNVVHLYEVLELIQDSKSTMFLILELVRGGELFDLISSNSKAIMEPLTTKKKIPDGWDETEFLMRKFFFELASGIYYCHANGIAHRDLKPENLLVHHGPNEECTLKIADFGLSATFALAHGGGGMSDQDTDIGGTSVVSSPTQSPVRTNSLGPAGESRTAPNPQSPIQDGISNISALGASALSYLTCGAMEDVFKSDANNFCGNSMPDDIQDDQPPSPLRRMTSVVGSPHYVAPEIISQSLSKSNRDEEKGKNSGYDGTKADVWSAGVILYAMLFRSLPFGEDLLRCPRYQSFRKWYHDVRKLGGRRSSAAAALDPNITEEDEQEMLGPHWFFPSETSVESRDLIVAMLNPDPEERLSIYMVLQHPWVVKDGGVIGVAAM